VNWQAIGAMGELVGGIAVILTLLYLAAQIRQNTISNRQTALQTISVQNAEWLSLIVQDEDVARIFRSGQYDLESLENEDAVRYGMLMTQFCRVFDTQYHQYLSGALTEDLWVSSERSIAFVMNRKGSKLWWSRYGNQFSDPFQKFMQQTIG
jgi:hypothetical protein